jgi:hypothetical protein
MNREQENTKLTLDRNQSPEVSQMHTWIESGSAKVQVEEKALTNPVLSPNSFLPLYLLFSMFNKSKTY